LVLHVRSLARINANACEPTGSIVVVGNVALDIARLLLKQPPDLAETDISTDALQLLARSTIDTVHVVGRRGSI
jgi:ferredoxin/flavodoxin---NADP+ reductase